MERLKFIFGEATEDSDFLLTFSKSNDPYNNHHYYLYALPAITKKRTMKLLGRIWISDSHPRFSSYVTLLTKSQDPRIKDEDRFGRAVGFKEPFTIIPSRFQTLINEDVAKCLFVLLSPSQRRNFIESLHVCIEAEDFERGRKESTLPTGLRSQFNFENWEKLHPIKKYLFSEIDYSNLPKI